MTTHLLVRFFPTWYSSQVLHGVNKLPIFGNIKKTVWKHRNSGFVQKNCALSGLVSYIITPLLSGTISFHIPYHPCIWYIYPHLPLKFTIHVSVNIPVSLSIWPLGPQINRRSCHGPPQSQSRRRWVKKGFKMVRFSSDWNNSGQKN